VTYILFRNTVYDKMYWRGRIFSSTWATFTRHLFHRH